MQNFVGNGNISYFYLISDPFYMYYDMGENPTKSEYIRTRLRVGLSGRPDHGQPVVFSPLDLLVT